MTDNPMRLTETGTVSQASRCGAKTRSGTIQISAGHGRRRCRMHGGADGSGAAPARPADNALRVAARVANKEDRVAA